MSWDRCFAGQMAFFVVWIHRSGCVWEICIGIVL